MSDAVWFDAVQLSDDDYVSVHLVGEMYVDDGVAKHRDHRIQIRRRSDTEAIELSIDEARQLITHLTKAVSLT